MRDTWNGWRSDSPDPQPAPEGTHSTTNNLSSGFITQWCNRLLRPLHGGHQAAALPVFRYPAGIICWPKDHAWRVLVVIRALGAVTPKLGKWHQQIPETTSEKSAEKQRLCTGPSSSQSSGRRPELEGWRPPVRARGGFFVSDLRCDLMVIWLFSWDVLWDVSS